MAPGNTQRQPETAILERIADGSASLEDFIAGGDVDQIIVEILGQEYGGPDGRRAFVSGRIIDALKRRASLSASASAAAP